VRKAVSCLLVAVAAACSRSELDLEAEPAAQGEPPDGGTDAAAGGDAGPIPMSTCFGAHPSPAPAPCSTWRIAGSDAVISGPQVPGGATYLTSLVPSGDGALVTWFTASSANTAAWDTRAIHADGTPRSAVVPHLSFPTMGGVYIDVMSLAVTPQCAFGGLVDDVDAGCRFLPLDGDGNETAPAVSLPAASGSGCGSLGPAPQGFSLLQEAPANSGTLDLVTVSTDGSSPRRVSLGSVPGYGTRIVLDDETFLLATFFENDASGDLTEDVAHYDATGIQMSPGATVTTASGSILLMAQTSAGVLSSYLGFDSANQSGQAMYVVPLRGDGDPMAAPVALDVTGAAGPLYGFSLDPTPSGDAFLTWNNLDEATSRYRFFAIELGPDGSPRGAPTALGIFDGVADVRVLVAADGEHAVIVYSGAISTFSSSGGVHTLPLACATH